MAQYKVIGCVPTDIHESQAWVKIVDAIRAGATSIEVVERSADGEDFCEIRAWIGRRHDRSNLKSFPPGTVPHCPACPEGKGG